MTDPRPGLPPQDGPHPRPEDVDTAFWLWTVALAMMVIGYVVDLVALPDRSAGGPAAVVYGISVVFLAVVASVVQTFLLLMRHGYRWTRTLLTGAGVATIIYSTSNLFGVDRPSVAAVGYAATAIVGSVCIAGGIYLLHRKDAHAFFTR